MAKVTTNLQVTIPRVLAERYGIQPGDEIEWLADADGIRLVRGADLPGESVTELLARFDEASQRQADRDHQRGPHTAPSERDWARGDLYRRGPLKGP